jgi:hypothetical protein
MTQHYIFNSKNDISVAMNEIEIFGNFSGLMINRNKTEDYTSLNITV